MKADEQPVFGFITDNLIPRTIEEYRYLKELAPKQLHELGLRHWVTGLWLFPKEWYEHIPEGFVCEGIMEDTFAFVPGLTDDDHRDGVLAYGVRIK